MGSKKYLDVVCNLCGDLWLMRSDNVKKWSGFCHKCYFKNKKLENNKLLLEGEFNVGLHKNGKFSKKKLLCEFCSKEFIKTSKKEKQRFCTLTCYHGFLKGKPLPESLLEIRKTFFGENHPNWKGGRSTEIQILRGSDNLKLWRSLVFKRDGYKCLKCNIIGSFLNAHHIENFSEHPDKRFDINNGITLCKTCHNNFHKNYGRTNNNRKQIEEYLL